MNRALSIKLIFFAATSWRTTGSVALRPGDEPEAGVLGLPGRALGAGLAAEILDLVVVGGPLLAVERDRRLRPELRCARECERLHVRPGRGDRDRRRHIDAGPGLVPVGIGRIRAVVGARLQDLGGDRLTELDPLRLRVAVRNRGEIGRQ